LTDRSHDQAVSRFAEHFASTLVDSGMPRMPARAFAALLVSDAGRLTAAELAERLQASPAAISGAVRYLSHVRMARREREPGARRDVIAINENWYETAVTTSPMLTAEHTNLQEGVKILGDSPAGDRVAETLALVEFLAEESRAMMQRWQERKAQLQSRQKR